MWEEGKQEKRPNDNINEELLNVKGYIDEKEAKILLYRFLRENITFSTKLLMGVDLFPFQHMAIKGMMKTDFYLGIWSRGLSKSWTTGVFAILEAMFNQGINIGILSKTFRQSKMIFRKIEDIAKTPKAALMSQCITHVSRSNDEWNMEVGRSHIIALPLGDGEKLRGFRFHVMIIDELLLMPEKILNEVVIPFLGIVEDPKMKQDIYDAETELIAEGVMEEKDRKTWSSNKLIGLSSASYKFEHLYKIYKDYENMILDPSQRPEGDMGQRCIMHFAYDTAPSQLYDANLVNQAKSTMSAAQFNREFGSQFTDDSSGYFKIKKMSECTIEDGMTPAVEIKGEPNAEYILAIDPSWSESDASDDFAMQVIRLDKKGKKGILVHSYAMSGTNLKSHISYLMYILKNFNIVQIVMDYNGGVQFLNAVNESSIFKKEKIEIKTIDDINFDDPTEYAKDIEKMKKVYNKADRRICFMRKPSSGWIRTANESLQAAFDHKKILFAAMAMDESYYRQIKMKIDLKGLKFLKEDTLHEKGNDARIIDLLEVQKENVELTKTECALIEVNSSAQGNQSFDLPLILKKQSGRNKARKDSYSALLLANWMMNIHYDMEDSGEPPMAGFTPMFID